MNDLLPESPQARAIVSALETLQQAGINAEFGMCLPGTGAYRLTLPPVLAIYTAVATLQAAGIDAALDSDTRTGLPIQITLRPGEPVADLDSHALAAQVHRLQTLQAAHVVAQAKRGSHG